MAKPSRDLFVENLEFWMSDRGVRSVDLAIAIDVSKATVTGWTHGKIAPDVEKLGKIATFLRIPVAALFWDKTDDRSIFGDEETSGRFLREKLRVETAEFIAKLNSPEDYERMRQKFVGGGNGKTSRKKKASRKS